MSDRFNNWRYPLFEDGKISEYNWIVQYVDGFVLGHCVDIGSFTYINAKYGVTLEDNVQIGSHCAIYSVSTIDDKMGSVILRRNCCIGSHSVVMPGVVVGENSIVGANSFVNKSLPANCIAVGCPAKIIKIKNERGEWEDLRVK